jgi:ATP-dependent RNA helicase RhlE
MSYIKFEQLKENIQKFEFSVESDFQVTCLKRIKSGGDFLINHPERREALLALLAGMVEKIQTPADDDAPRILIVAPSREACLEIEELWVKLSKRTEMIHTLTYEAGDKVKQRLALFNGADIVIGTPKRVNELYFQMESMSII